MAEDPDLCQAVDPFLQCKIFIKDIIVLKKHILTMRDHFLPVFHAGLYQRCFHQPEILCIQVRPDVKLVFIMADKIFQFLLPCLENLEFPIRF